MAIDYLNKNGLSYFWSKLKAYFAPKAHTHNAFETKHSYTTAANAAKNWYRIANASTQQLDTSKPIRAQFIVTAYNTSYAADYYETWFVNAIVFGRTAHIVVFGNSSVPFSQARILYENTVAAIDANDRPVIDLYLNYVLPNGTTKIEVEEIYNNGGWTFVADGQLAASSTPSGFEGLSSAPRNNGVNNSTFADYVSYLNRQISNFTAAFTLDDSYLYRSRTLNCTGTFTITIPSINSGYMWCVIKNKNTSSGVITLHPSTTSVLIDGSNANITLQPMEYVCIHSAGANNYSLIADGRFSIKTVASAKSVSTENPSTHTKLFYTVGQPAIGTTAGKAYEGSSSDYSLLSFPTNGTVHNTSANIQNLRLMWINSTTYFTDIFVSPNNHYIWHRDVMGGIAYGWRRLVEENVTGIAAPTWDISIGGNAATASAVAWSGVTSKPTTISGYGITDAKIANGTITLGSSSITPITSHQTLPTLSRTISGSGNAITDITVSNHAITATKGATFLTSHQTLPTLSKTDSGSGNAVTAISVNDHAITVTKGSTFALDSDVIHKDSNEAIEGIKEFSNSYQDSTIEGETDWESSSLIIRYKNYIKGSGVPSANKYANLIFLDKTGTNINWNGRLGIVENDVLSSGIHRTRLICYKNEVVDGVDSRDYAAISVGYDSLGREFAAAPSTSDVRTAATDILTRDWIPKDTRIVHTNTDQTITGHKTFQYWLATYATYFLHSTSLVRRTIPSSYTAQYVTFEDKNGVNLSLITFGVDSTGSSLLHFGVYDFGKTATSLAFGVGCSCAYNSTNYQFRPFSDNDVLLGAGSRRWKQLYAGTTTIATSDERFKQNIETVPDNVLDVWEDVSFCQFKMRDAVEEKGSNARLHNGLIAQQIEKIFSSKGLNASDYGLFCYDSWEHKDASINEKGSVLEEELLAGDRYSLRYEEALCMEAAYMRRENARLKKRVSDLEERLAALELRLGSE